MARKKKSDRPLEADVTIFKKSNGRLECFFGAGQIHDADEEPLVTIDVSRLTRRRVFQELSKRDMVADQPRFRNLILEAIQTGFEAGLTYVAPRKEE